MKKKIIRNTLISSSSSVINALIGFLLMPFMIHKMGIVEFGLFGMSNIFAIGGYVSLLELGFQSAITKYAAEYTANKDQTGLFELATSSFVLFLVIGFLLMLTGNLLLNVFANSMLKISAAYTAVFKKALFIIFISYIFQFPNIVLMGLIEGRQRYDILRGVFSLFMLLRAAAIVIVLELGYKFFGVIVATLIVLFLQFVVYLFFVFKTIPGFRFNVKCFSINQIKKVGHLSKLVFVRRVASLIYNQADRLFVGVFLGPNYMASFDALIKLPKFFKNIVGFGQSAVLPAASEIATVNDKKKLNKLYITGLKFNLVFATPIIIAAAYFAKPFFQFWLGQRFVFLASLLRVILIWNLLTPLLFGGNMLLGMKRKLKEVNYIAWGTTLLKIGIILILINKVKLWAIVFGAVGSYILLPLFIRIFIKEFNLKAIVFLKEVFVIFVIALVPFIIFRQFGQIIPTTNFILLILKFSLWCIIYWVLAYFFVFNTENRQVLKDFVLTKKHKEAVNEKDNNSNRP